MFSLYGNAVLNCKDDNAVFRNGTINIGELLIVNFCVISARVIANRNGSAV